jgi:serine/threonine protein kinase
MTSTGQGAKRGGTWGKLSAWMHRMIPISGFYPRRSSAPHSVPHSAPASSYQQMKVGGGNSSAPSTLRNPDCLKDTGIIPTELLGRGEYGSVWATTDSVPSSGKRWILKVSDLDGDKERTESFKREIYFLRKLQNTDVVPELKLAVECDGQGLQIMERFNGSLQDLGYAQGQLFGLHPKYEVALTQEQIDATVDLVHRFDRYSVIHGDLKRGNILQRNRGKHQVVADFGFTGARESPYHPLLGFVHNYGCDTKTLIKDGDTKLRTPIPKALVPYANRWQIWTDFVGGRKTFIIPVSLQHILTTDNPPYATRQLRRSLRELNPKTLAKALNLPHKIVKAFRKICTTAP